MNQNLRLFSPDTEAAIAEPGRTHFDHVLKQLKHFLADNGERVSTSLAQVSQTGLLSKFSSREYDLTFDDNDAITGHSKRIDLISEAYLDDRYPHLPIVMALAHEGGEISGLSRYGVTMLTIVIHLSKLSPQHLIATAGLVPGRKATRMYIDLFSWILSKEPDLLLSCCVSHGRNRAETTKAWIRCIASLANQSREGRTFSLLHEDSQQSFRLKPLEHQDMGAYTDYLNSIDLDGGSFSERQVIDTLFFAEAFELLENTHDTSLALKVLSARATWWAHKISDHAPSHDDLVEQLVGCAMFAHPEHFRKAGFGLRNLHGMPFEHITERTARSILAGPLAFYSQPLNTSYPQYNDRPAAERVFNYAQSLVPELRLETLAEHSGFRHPLVIPLISLHGGHMPIADVILADSSPTPAELEWLLEIVQGKEAYADYQPESLVKLLAHKFDKIPATGVEVGYDSNAYTKNDLEVHRRGLFVFAIMKNPGLKDALIKHLETRDIVTPDHLYLAGIEPSEAPSVVRKMSLSDQGKLFSSDLGL